MYVFFHQILFFFGKKIGRYFFGDRNIETYDTFVVYALYCHPSKSLHVNKIDLQGMCQFTRIARTSLEVLFVSQRILLN